MKYFFKSLLLLIASLILFGCQDETYQAPNTSVSTIENPTYGKYQDLEMPPFEFELVDSLRLQFPDGYILSGVDNLITDAKGNIYFMDRQQFKLISVSPTGDVRWMIGEKGRGPGDFENVYSMITNGNHIYVGNLNGSRIDKFDLTGSLIRSYNAPEEINFGTLQGFLESGEMIFAAPNWQTWGPQIFIADFSDDSLSVLNNFFIDQTGDNETVEGTTSRSSITVYQNNIYTGSITDYSIEMHDTTGTLEKTILRDFDKIVRPGVFSNGEYRGIRFFGSVEAPEFLPNGQFIVTANWPTNLSDPDNYMEEHFMESINNGNAPEIENENSLDIYSADGTLLYSFEHKDKNPEIGSIQYVDDKGIIYTTKFQPEPIIYKYRLADNK